MVTGPDAPFFADAAVDPVSHLMLGGAIAAAIPRASRPRGTTVALVLGSIFPDADLALVPRGFDLYLQAHAGGTHSLTWSFVEALVFAGLLRPLVRASRFRTLACAGWIGIAGHIVSDCLDGSDIMLFAPLSHVQYGWHLFGMGEPFVLMLLGAACLTAWRWPARARLVAVWAFASLAALLAAKAVTKRWAAAEYVMSVPEPQSRVEIMSVRSRLFEWAVYDQVDDHVRVWRIDARTGRHELLFDHHNAAGPLVTASHDLPIVRGLLARTQIPVVRVEQDGGNLVALWSDARMCSARRCDVSFGGVFTPDGVPLFQVIRVGGFQQIRPLPRG